MSEEILQLIYKIGKNYQDPLSKLPLDKNNKNFNVIAKNGNVNVSIVTNTKYFEDSKNI